MKVAIIGSGNVGTALAKRAVLAGHQVTLASAHAEHAARAAVATGAAAGPDASTAVAGADVVVLAVPAAAVAEVAAQVASVAPDAVIVDVTNRPTPDPAGPATSIAEELQAAVPGARVVKAFNTLFASRQAQPEVEGVTADGFVAADDATAKARVLELVASLGLRPVDAGPLAVARTLEGMAWLNISRNLEGGTWQDAWVLAGPDARN